MRSRLVIIPIAVAAALLGVSVVAAASIMGTSGAEQHQPTQQVTVDEPGPPWLTGRAGDDGEVPKGPKWFRESGTLLPPGERGEAASASAQGEGGTPRWLRDDPKGATGPAWLLGEPNEDGVVPEGPRWWREATTEAAVADRGPRGPKWFRALQ
jgi:hypothetical protein